MKVLLCYILGILLCFGYTNVLPNQRHVLKKWIQRVKRSDYQFPIQEQFVIPKKYPKFFDCTKCQCAFSNDSHTLLLDGKLISGQGKVFIASTVCNLQQIEYIEGYFSKGELSGNGQIFFSNGSFLICSFLMNAIHGLARKFDCKFGSCNLFENSQGEKRVLKEV
jgi:hypothetical protein